MFCNPILNVVLIKFYNGIRKEKKKQKNSEYKKKS